MMTTDAKGVGAMDLWIVGRWREETGTTEFCGVFDSEALALSQCTTYNHWLAPAHLNEYLPLEAVKWEGLRYPNAEPPQ